MTDPAEQLHIVSFEPHSRPAAEPEAAAREFVADLFDGDVQPGGESFDHQDEGGSVGFPSSEIAQHDRLRLEGDVHATRDVAQPGCRYLKTCSPTQRLNGESANSKFAHVALVNATSL